MSGTLKLSTITSETSASVESLEKGSIQLGFLTSQFKDRFSFKKYQQKEVWLLPIEKASPLSTLSWKDWFILPKAMKLYSPDLYEVFVRFCDGLPQFARFQAYFKMYADSNLVSLGSVRLESKSTRLMLGKLSTKEEAAGKIRVFAMVDVWTQSVLKPLHDLIFSFLKSLPNDGTFDQSASVKRATAKAQK